MTEDQKPINIERGKTILVVVTLVCCSLLFGLALYANSFLK